MFSFDPLNVQTRFTFLSKDTIEENPSTFTVLKGEKNQKIHIIVK